MTEPGPPSSPRIPSEWITPVVALHSGTEAEVFAAVARRLAAALTALGGPSVDTLRLTRDLDALTRRLALDAEPAVTDLIARAYRTALPDADRPDTLIGRVLELLRTIWRRIRTAGLDLAQRALGIATVTPPDTRRAAVQQVLDRAADRGVVAYRDARGRQWGLGPAVGTVLGDAAHGAGVDGFAERILAEGGDLVIVTKSPHPCPICRPWERRVLSASGSDPARPSVATARAAGLFHPHCRHTLFAWQPGFRWPEHIIEHLPGTYEAEQRQRVIERHIRRWKRREAAALDDLDDLARQKARRHVQAWQAELRTHLDSTGLQRSTMRERTDFARTAPARHALGA